MTQALNYQRTKILKDLEQLPVDKLVEVEDFIEFLKEKYVYELKEETKDFDLKEKDIITSPYEERRELEKTCRYSKEFLDQFERNLAKSTIYSRKS